MEPTQSEKLRIDLPWEEETFLQGAKILYDYTRKHSWRRYLGPIFVGVALFGLIIALRTGMGGMLFVGSLLSIYWYVLSWRRKKQSLKAQFAQAELAGKRLRIVADEKGLKADGSPIPWEAISLTLSTPRGYLLVIDNGFLFFHREIFPDKQTRRRFGDLLAEHTAGRFRKFP